MNIYLLEQDLNNGYETYDSLVVVAEDEIAARNINPSPFFTHVKDGKWMGTDSKGNEFGADNYEWVRYSQIDKIKVTLIGVANDNQEAGVICSSFNKG